MQITVVVIIPLLTCFVTIPVDLKNEICTHTHTHTHTYNAEGTHIRCFYSVISRNAEGMHIRCFYSVISHKIFYYMPHPYKMLNNAYEVNMFGSYVCVCVCVFAYPWSTLYNHSSLLYVNYFGCKLCEMNILLTSLQLKFQIIVKGKAKIESKCY